MQNQHHRLPNRRSHQRYHFLEHHHALQRRTGGTDPWHRRLLPLGKRFSEGRQDVSSAARSGGDEPVLPAARRMGTSGELHCILYLTVLGDRPAHEDNKSRRTTVL